MEADLYIDVVFLFNGTMNSLILLAAGKLVEPSPKLYRAFLGGFAASFCNCLLWICLFPLGGGIWLSLILQTVGIFIAYAPKTRKRFFALLAAVWLCSFLIGGGMAALSAFTDIQRIFGTGILLRKGLTPWQFVWWAGCVFYVLLHFWGRWMEEHIAKKQLFCNGEIIRRGKRCEIRGLLDTGNGLEKEGRGIVVVEFSSCLSLFDKDLVLTLLKKGSLSKEEMELEGFSETGFSALGVEKGNILLFQGDSLQLFYNKKRRIYREIKIGIYFGTFAGGYTALVPPTLLEEEEG